MNMRFLVMILGILMPLSIFAQTRQIAITIDDAPMGDGPYFSGERRGQMLRQRLKQSGVEQALFFVITGQIDAEGDQRLRNYVEDGHKLGNHTHSHPSAHRLDWEEYLAEVARADSILKPRQGFAPLFRYPYLHEGQDSLTRESIRRGLLDLGYANGYVTVDTYDWYLHALVREAKAEGKSIRLNALRQWWVDHQLQNVEFYDSVAVATLGRSPQHVLLLHENDLTALFIGDLVQQLELEGWEIIPATQAYSDAIASYVPETLFLGQGRVAAIAADQGSEPAALVPKWQNEEYLRAEAVRREVFGE